METKVDEPRVDQLLTIRQVAETYGVAPVTVRRLVDLGRLTPIRLMERGRLRFRAADVQRLIDDGEGL
jgi:excisionase family DNA binding protein